MARIFCTEPNLKKFHSVFISCNESDGLNKWCKECEKCAFVFLILSAWLPPIEVLAIFNGVNLFANPNNVNLFLSLIRGTKISGSKPYECIGTFAESSAAIELSLYQIIIKMQSEKPSATQIIAVDADSICLDHHEILNEIPIVLQVLVDNLQIVFDKDLLRIDDVTRGNFILKKWLPN